MSRNRSRTFADYLRIETVGGGILLAAAAVALILANSPLAGAYTAVRDYPLGAGPLRLSVGQWASDGVLALFFYVAGLELKRELTVGELTDRRAAVLPVAAALGGMIVPALIAFGVAAGTPGAGRAWAIPVATDIAFALGVLALTGTRMPSGARVFLLSLAVVDDLGAIVLIAVLFTGAIHLLAAAVAVVLLAVFGYLQRRRVRSTLLYLPLALGTWLAVHESGVHATVAGVALGLLTRVRADPGEPAAPGPRLERRLQPLSAGFAVPVFAVFAAGVPLSWQVLGGLFTDRLTLGVLLGLLVGKLAGIVGGSALAVKLRAATLPAGLGWRDLTAVAMLGGVGFTVSLLLAELSLSDPAAQRAKAAVLLASMIAGLLAAALLLRRGRVHATAATAGSRTDGVPGAPPAAPRGTMCRVTGASQDPIPAGSSAVPSIPLSAENPAAVADKSVGALVRDVTTHMSTLVRAEVELAKAEVTNEVKKGVKGGVFFIVALTIVLFSLFFLFFAIAELLADLGLYRSGAFGIVFGLMLLLAGLFGYLGYRKVKKIRAPERTITTAKETVTALKNRGGDEPEQITG